MTKTFTLKSGLLQSCLNVLAKVRLLSLVFLNGRDSQVEKQTPKMTEQDKISPAPATRPIELWTSRSKEMQLSKNYTLADLTTGTAFPHRLCAQRGKTEAELLVSLGLLACNILEPLHAKYGKTFLVTSAFRVAGAGNSQHYLGEAVDVQFAGLSKSGGQERALEMMALFENYDQFIVEYHGKYGPIFHISYREGRCRRQALTTPDLKQYLAGVRSYDEAVRALV